MSRRTLKDISYYPTPTEIIERLENSEGWIYKTRKEFFACRDKALIALLYLTGLRISEALRLKKKQFRKKRNHLVIQEILLSKSRVEGRPRRTRFREAFIPLKNERKSLGILVKNYLDRLQDESRLFPWSLKKNRFGQIVGTRRAWQIVNAYFPEFTTHWFRAFCEDYLYENWKYDLLAVSDYIKIDPATLQEYIRKRYQKYPVI